MSLDCVSPRGLTYIERQTNCLCALERAWGVQMLATPNAEAADVDALAVREGKVVAVLEVKSREMGLDQLRRFGSYLITFDKLMKLRAVAAALCVPGLVVVSLLKDQRVVMWKICDAGGRMMVPLEGKVSQTQATCNGGSADRYNAYLSLDAMEIVL